MKGKRALAANPENKGMVVDGNHPNQKLINMFTTMAEYQFKNQVKDTDK